jgi:hypothetical protein
MIRRKPSLSSNKKAQVADLNASNVASNTFANNTTFTNVSDDFMGADVATYTTDAMGKHRGSSGNFYVGQPRKYSELYQTQNSNIERVTSF